MPRLRSMGRLIAWTLAAVLLLATALAAFALWQVHRSVPTLDGQARVPGLHGAVTISRDERGTAIVKGADRLDVARGLGFVHAQERFFEMDLARRSAAGELSELFGAVALERDKTRRRHRMRATLDQRYAGMDARDHALLQAYADGVNAGLAQLGVRPWQYLMLRAEPRPWQPVDSLLVIGEMFWMLQGSSVDEGFERAQWRACAGDDLFDRLEPGGGRWDAALDGSVLVPPPLPGPEQLDLRKAAPVPPPTGSNPPPAVAVRTDFLPEPTAPDRHEPLVGSNNWAVSGARSVTGDAMLANDMHLGLGVPATWFRAQFEIGAGATAIRAEGVTLPGLPALVVGSNGKVAWGFTNSYGQWFDWVEVPRVTEPGELTQVQETILVKGAPEMPLTVRQFLGRPILETQGDRSWALNWVADQGVAYNLELDDMLEVDDVESAGGVAGLSGIPEQNIVIADHHGHIAWTIAGALFATNQSAASRFGRFIAPARAHKLSSALLADMSEAPARTRPQLGQGLGPSIENPADGQLWTANARTFGVAGQPGTPAAPLTPIGDGGVDLGARAQQIRDRLRAAPKFDEKSLGAIHFDDEARFLDSWKRRIAAVASARPVVLDVLERWNGHADADQTAYRLVRETRLRTLQALWKAWSDPIVQAGQCPKRAFDWHARFEYAGEEALDQRPAHLLPHGFASWDAFLLAQVDASVADMTRNGGRPLAQASWGEKNASHIGHVLSRAVPVLSRWLDMPSLPQSGDVNMPHVAAPSFGQSERLVVAPGHEERATLAMPGGQSGHPMSPYYGAGHEDWVAGRPTPLLAGAARHVLTLTP